MSVYFARVGEFVKVGCSANPTKRIGRIRSDDGAKPLDLDRAAPIETLKVIPGTRGDEQSAHAALADFRVAGEWFLAEPDLLAWIAAATDATFPHLSRAEGEYQDPRGDLSGERLLAAALAAWPFVGQHSMRPAPPVTPRRRRRAA